LSCAVEPDAWTPAALRVVRFGIGGVKKDSPPRLTAVYQTNRDSRSHRSPNEKLRVMKGLIVRIGPCDLVPDTRRSPFESLVRAVAHQQLNGIAAESILRRLRELCGTIAIPSRSSCSL
jgi:3-methyladenine DNA glycosylase/8-oxoguanine DNA glycosylase